MEQGSAVKQKFFEVDEARIGTWWHLICKLIPLSNPTNICMIFHDVSSTINHNTHLCVASPTFLHTCTCYQSILYTYNICIIIIIILLSVYMYMYPTCTCNYNVHVFYIYIHVITMYMYSTCTCNYNIHVFYTCNYNVQVFYIYM